MKPGLKLVSKDTPWGPRLLLADETGVLPHQHRVVIDEPTGPGVSVTVTFGQVEIVPSSEHHERDPVEPVERDPKCSCGTNRVCDVHHPEA